jgi:type VI protein secretion system component Hcp
MFVNNSVDRRRTLRLAVLLGGVALGLSLTTGARAATDLFLTWPGIVGTSQVKGHQGDIELVSYTQSASNIPTSPGNGPGTGRTQATPVCGQITIMKRVDQTSPVFLGMVLSGNVTAGPVIFTFAKAGSSTPDTTYYTVSLRKVIPTSITQSDSLGDDAITETIVLAASQFVFTYTPQLANGSSGTPVSFGWDCVTNKAL